jgi:DNA-binding transcriptional MocR family regulator
MALVSAPRLSSLVGDLRSARPPVYAALASRVQLLVADGRLPVGVRLPAERDLGAALGLSRATVTAAYRRLREDGWATARQGSGTFTALPAGTASGAWVPAPAAEGLVDLAHAAPGAPPEVASAYAAALAELPRLLPGHGYHPEGLPDLRARIADRYTARGLPTTPEQVLVTAGALHGVATVAEVLVRASTRVLVESPSYPNALDALRARRARLVPVPLAPSDDGADRYVAEVTRVARESSPALAYLMPDFQNPTGLVLDGAQRARLAAGLQGAGTVAIVDETLAELVLDGEAPPAYGIGGRADRVVTVGSLSKSFWGGLRIGWLRAEPALVQRLAGAALRTYMSGPAVEQLAACHLLDGADATLAVRRTALRQQRDALVDALATHLPSWQARVPAGGLVLWCRLPMPMSSSLVEAARRRGVLLAAGPRFAAGVGGAAAVFEDRLRLPFSQPVDVLERAVPLLAEAVREVGEVGVLPDASRLVV